MEGDKTEKKDRPETEITPEGEQVGILDGEDAQGLRTYEARVESKWRRARWRQVNTALDVVKRTRASAKGVWGLFSGHDCGTKSRAFTRMMWECEMDAGLLPRSNIALNFAAAWDSKGVGSIFHKIANLPRKPTKPSPAYGRHGHISPTPLQKIEVQKIYLCPLCCSRSRFPCACAIVTEDPCCLKVMWGWP